MHDVTALHTDREAPLDTATAARPPRVPTVPLAAWLEPALALPLVELGVDVEVGRSVRLGSPACAIVRGLFGQRLRELRCSTGAATCSGCEATSGCDYARVFDGETAHPFWLQGIPATAELVRGTRWCARMYLAAPAHGIVPYVDVALRDALARLLPDARRSTVHVRVGTIDELAGGAVTDTMLRIRIETPLALRGDEAVCQAMCPRAPWLALVARAGVRRLDALVQAFAPPPGGRLPRAELPDLEAIEVVRGAISPWSSSRWSHRQEQRLPLTGVHGEIVVRGDALPALAPLLRALTVTSVGKAASLGLGTLRLEAAATPGRPRAASPLTPA